MTPVDRLLPGARQVEHDEHELQRLDGQTGEPIAIAETRAAGAATGEVGDAVTAK